MNIKIGDTIPNKKVFIFLKNNPKEININELLINSKVVLFGLPGAYTSVCSTKHLPGFIDLYDEFKSTLALSGCKDVSIFHSRTAVGSCGQGEGGEHP